MIAVQVTATKMTILGKVSIIASILVNTVRMDRSTTDLTTGRYGHAYGNSRRVRRNTTEKVPVQDRLGARVGTRY